MVEDCAKQRLRGENVHEICLGGIETITRYIFHDLVGEADKFAVIAWVSLLEYLNRLWEIGATEVFWI